MRGAWLLIIARLMTCQFQALSFDLDGTLASVGWRRIGLWRGFLAWPRVVGAYEPAVKALRGRRVRCWSEALLAEVSQRSGEPPERAQAGLDAVIGKAWPRLFAGARPPKPVRDLLRAADEAGLPRVVVSDHAALDKLSAMGLGGWAAVIDCSALGALKPLPDGLWAASAQLGVPIGRVLHVGDRWDTDGRAAEAAGCAFLHVDTPDLVRSAGL